MPRTSSTLVSRNAARRAYDDYQRHVAAFTRLVDEHEARLNDLLASPETEELTLRLAVRDFRELVRTIERTLGAEIPSSLGDRYRTVHFQVVRELLRRAGGDPPKRAFALDLPQDILRDGKSKPSLGKSPLARTATVPPYPHVDHPAMVRWREQTGVTRADHAKLLKAKSFASGVVRRTWGTVALH